LKSLLFIFVFLSLLTGCSQNKPDKYDYVGLVPVKLEKATIDKQILDEISHHKSELEKLETMHKYIIEDKQLSE